MDIDNILTGVIEDTVMFLTNDLPSLLEQDYVAEIRRNHKNELLKNIPNAKAQIEKALLEALPEKMHKEEFGQTWYNEALKDVKESLSKLWNEDEELDVLGVNQIKTGTHFAAIETCDCSQPLHYGKCADDPQEWLEKILDNVHLNSSKGYTKVGLKRAILTEIATIERKAEEKGIMYCYLMGGVTPRQQRYMEVGLKKLRGEK